MNRGDVYDVDWPGAGRRPAVIVTRQAAVPFLANVTVALITTTIRRLPTEVVVDRAVGLAHESAINCDNLFTVPKPALGRYRGSLAPAERAGLFDALRTALDLE